jgi:hypothetical protein
MNGMKEKVMPDVAVITIGNSDDKLKQAEWSQFVSAMADLVMRWRMPIHFHGCSVGSAPWQNACWVVDIKNLDHPDHLSALRYALSEIAETWRQDSIALTLGNTEMVKPGK